MKATINSLAPNVTNRVDELVNTVEGMGEVISRRDERVEGLENELAKTQHVLQQETTDIRERIRRVESMQYSDHQLFKNMFAHLDEQFEMYADETHHNIQQLKRKQRKLLIAGGAIALILIVLIFFI